MNISLKNIPLEFEIERRFKDEFGSDVRKFKLVKVYNNQALYECYRKDENNQDVHLFYECFSFSYLWNEEYKLNKRD